MPRKLPGFYDLAPHLEPLVTVIPSVSFKTDENMHKTTANAKREPISDIPYWGTAQDLANRYLYGADA